MIKGKNMCIALRGKTITELRNVTCHMGSHSVTCHPTQVNAPRLNPMNSLDYKSATLNTTLYRASHVWVGTFWKGQKRKEDGKEEDGTEGKGKRRVGKEKWISPLFG